MLFMIYQLLRFGFKKNVPVFYLSACYCMMSERGERNYKHTLCTLCGRQEEQMKSSEGPVLNLYKATVYEIHL